MPYKDLEKRRQKQREYSKKHYDSNKNYFVQQAHNNRKKLLEEISKIKESSPCMDCKNFFPAVAMDFDHRDPTKKIAGISNLVKLNSKDKLFKEIEKCDLVCSNCHRIRTAKKNQN